MPGWWQTVCLQTFLQATSTFIAPSVKQRWEQQRRSSEVHTTRADVIQFAPSNESLSAVFTFQVAQKLRQGRPLLDAGVPSADMQDSSHSHFVGYLGPEYEEEIKPRLVAAVEEYQVGALSVAECAQRILHEFMKKLVASFTKVDIMEPQIALDRELQVMYCADLAASYIILFCPLGVRQELYRYLWGNGAFLDGNINWLCCPWVLNQEKHDEEYHNYALDLEKLSNEEIIDIIRLHKNYLSTDYVKQRSRDALKQLDRRSLLSVFQSVMLRVLWGREAVSENQEVGHNDEEEEFVQPEASDVRKEAISISTLSGWLEEYRAKRGKATLEVIPAPRRLQLRETEYNKQMKRSIDVITRNMEYFNEAFKGVPGDVPFVEAAIRQSSESLPDMSDIGEDITLDRIRSAFKTLLNFYRCNLASSSELYGHVPNVKVLNLLKLLLSYEKHELITILSAVLLALPEFSPIANEQDFAQYAMIPFNTLAKLCFIAIMRINPKIAYMNMGVELDETEIGANQQHGINQGFNRFSGNPESEGPSTKTDGLEDLDSDIDEYTNEDANVKDIASMLFTLEELQEIEPYINRKNCKIVETEVYNERKKCITLDTRRTRPVTESILMHLSNYDVVYEVLKNVGIEAPVEGNQDVTIEAIRKNRLAAVLRRMSDSEVNQLYDRVIQNSKMHEELKIPEEIYKLTHHCLLDDLEGELKDGQVYSKLMEILTRMDEEQQQADIVISESVTQEGVDNEEGDFMATADGERVDSAIGGGFTTETSVKPVTTRDHCLNLIEGEDITPFIDKSFSSPDPQEMTDDELMRIADKVLERMEQSENTKVINYDPKTPYARDFHLQAMMERTTDSRLMDSHSARRQAFRLRASSYDFVSGPSIEQHLDAADADDEELPREYGVGIFPKRTTEKMDYSWQYPETMKSSPLLRNKLSIDGTESYVGSWKKLGLINEVATAAVAWIRKSLLDTICSMENTNLEIQPTEIQKMAIDCMLKTQEDVLIASNAASGKTLAYMLPIIQKLKEQEKLKLRYPNSPRALILVPSRELADQTLRVLKGLGHIVKLSSESVAGGCSKGRQRDHMKRLVDFVVATPDRLLKMIKHVRLNRLQYLVLDEADTLLNEGFWPEVAQILEIIKHPYSLVQVAPTSRYLLHFQKVQKAMAKVPNMKGVPNKTPEINEKFLVRFVNVKHLVETAWVDRPNRGVSHEFRYFKGEDKARELVNLLRYEHVRRCKKVLVFCNSIPSCRAVEHILRNSDLPATSLHGKIPILKRRKYYEDFINGSTGILVCSDLASRGLDFNADVALMFDFPLNSMDYLKRCGRVGRMINNDGIAPRGYAVSFVKKRDRNLAIAIERSIRMPFFPVSSLSRRKEDYNQRSGRLKHLTQAGGYFKLAKLLREEEIKGTYDYGNMDQYLEQFKAKVTEMYQSSLKKIVLRRRRICKRRRILTRRLKLMKRYNRAIRLKQRIISHVDRMRRLKKYTIHSPMYGDERRCPPMKDLRPIRAKILELKLMEDKMTRRLLERNDRNLRKFINKTQQVARSLVRPEVSQDQILDMQLPMTIIERAKEKLRHKVKRICALL